MPATPDMDVAHARETARLGSISSPGNLRITEVGAWQAGTEVCGRWAGGESS